MTMFRLLMIFYHYNITEDKIETYRSQLTPGHVARKCGTIGDKKWLTVKCYLDPKSTLLLNIF